MEQPLTGGDRPQHLTSIGGCIWPSRGRDCAARMRGCAFAGPSMSRAPSKKVMVRRVNGRLTGSHQDALWNGDDAFDSMLVADVSDDLSAPPSVACKCPETRYKRLYNVRSHRVCCRTASNCVLPCLPYLASAAAHAITPMSLK